MYRVAPVFVLIAAACAPASRLRPRAVSTLRDALSARAPEVRIAAIQAAERLDEPSLFDPVTRLLADDDERVRAAAAGATLKGHPDAPRVLTDSLTADHPEARVIAVVALGRKVGKLAAADLRAALADPDATVREAAVQALAPLALEADLDRLLRVARSDVSGPVRARAVTALGHHAARARARVRDAAGAAFADPYLGVRLASVDVLRATGGVLPTTDPLLRLRSGVDLGAAVRAAAASGEAEIRAAAANAAGAAEAALVEALVRDPDPAVRLAAARALMRAGRNAEARDVFTRGLGLADPWLRLQAAIDLARLGDARALDPFTADAAVATRLAALAAYPYRGELPRVWVVALDDPEPAVRITAAELILAKI